MRDYVKEINECRMEIKRLDNEIDQLNFKLESMYSALEEAVYADEKYILTKKIGQLHDMICKLSFERYDMVEKLNDLRRNYRRTQVREYYHPMDNIDILVTIRTKGYISGTKL